MLSLEIPELWTLQDDNITAVLRTFNDSVAKIRKEHPQKIGAFGAIDSENVAHALEEIDYCLKTLKLDGICLYVKIVGKSYEEMFEDRLLKKLSEIGVPVLVHPKESDGIPIFNENYLDSVAFIFSMLYLDKYEYLMSTNYILAHTGGLVRFLARPVGNMHYVDPKTHTPRKGKILIDMFIIKNEKGYEYLKSIKVDD